MAQQEAVQALARYASARGARASGIEIRLGGGERGVYATRELEQAEPLIAVPLYACVSADAIPDSVDTDGVAAAPWPCRMASALMLAHDAYAQALPSMDELETIHPVALHEQSLNKALPACPATLEARLLALRQMAHVHARTCTPGGFNENSSAETVFERWAVPIALSRTIGLAGVSAPEAQLVHNTPDEDVRFAPEGDGTLRVLAPLVDMLNHESTPGAANVTWDVYGEKESTDPLELVVSCTQKIECGEEVCASYGAKAGDEFVAHYGFLPEDNGAEEAVVFISIEHMMQWLKHQYTGDGYELLSSRLERAKQELHRAASKAGTAETQSERMMKVKNQQHALDTRMLSAFDAFFQSKTTARLHLAQRCDEARGVLQAQEAAATQTQRHGPSDDAVANQLSAIMLALNKRKQAVLQQRADELRLQAI